MASEAEQVSTNTSTQDEKKKRPEGLKLFGYIIPWWVVLVVVCLALYMAYEKGYLADVVGKPDGTGMFMGTQEVALAGPVIDVQPVNTPTEIAEIKRFGLFRNRW